jgi:dTDP-4-amino-4,6-dideoxygalactose transaminase
MLVTDEEDIAKRAKAMRLHGIDRDIWNRFTAKKPSWEYDVIAPGFKYNLPDLAAAVGLAQLERAHIMHRQRAIVAAKYIAALQGIQGFDLPLVHCAHMDHAWHFFHTILTPRAKMNRNQFIEFLMENDIGFSVHYKPLHHMTYYKERYTLRPEDFPNTERHWKGCVSLPLYPSMTEQESDRVIEVVRKALI